MQQSELSLTPAARRTDPQTSHEAERAMNDSGARLTQADRLARLIKKHQGKTCGELAVSAMLEDDPSLRLTERQISRRLKDAEARGLIKAGEPHTCKATGAKARIWWPA